MDKSTDTEDVEMLAMPASVPNSDANIIKLLKRLGCLTGHATGQLGSPQTPRAYTNYLLDGL